jgi:hypothetical protein
LALAREVVCRQRFWLGGLQVPQALPELEALEARQAPAPATCLWMTQRESLVRFLYSPLPH